LSHPFTYMPKCIPSFLFLVYPTSKSPVYVKYNVKWIGLWWKVPCLHRCYPVAKLSQNIPQIRK
jgi:hypothetical protein